MQKLFASRIFIHTMKSPARGVNGFLFAFLVMSCLDCGWRNTVCQNSRTSQSTGVTSYPPSQRDYESETYAVLSAVVRDFYLDKPLVVIQRADPCPPTKAADSADQKSGELRQQEEQYAFERMPQLARETIGDFHARAAECHSLTRKFDIPGEYVLVGRNDLELIFRKGELDRAWNRFYAKYPGSSGIVNFSNPGFNRAFTQALISTGRVCGGLCGAGSLVLLKKDQGVWRVETKVGTWIS